MSTCSHSVGKLKCPRLTCVTHFMQQHAQSVSSSPSKELNPGSWRSNVACSRNGYFIAAMETTSIHRHAKLGSVMVHCMRGCSYLHENCGPKTSLDGSGQLTMEISRFEALWLANLIGRKADRVSREETCGCRQLGLHKCLNDGYEGNGNSLDYTWLAWGRQRRTAKI